MSDQIKIIKRKDLDVQAYDACVERSPNAKLYALSDWLEHVDPNWFTLVYGDYIGVMPFSVKRRWLWKKMYVPPFTQQLGLFTDSVDFYQMAEAGLNLLKSKYSNIIYQGNHAMSEPTGGLQVRMRDNFVLKWSRENEEDYNDSHRRKLKKSRKAGVEIRECLWSDFYPFCRDHFPVFEKDVLPSIKMFKSLTQDLLDKGNAIITAAYYQEEMVACVFWGLYRDTLYYLFSSVNPLGRKIGANIHLIQESPTLVEGARFIDFEGSEIPGVRDFMLRFNPVLVPYPLYSKGF